MKGPYTGPHSADFLRGALTYLYGGVFMDVGIILVRSLDKMCWDILSDPCNPQQISVPWMYGTTMANHFIAARQHDPFIKRWHDFCADYAQKNILRFDALEEDWAAETVVGYQGEKLFEALTTRLHEDPESERYKRAYETVWRILTNSSMQKVTHGKKLTKTPALGVLLDKPENANKDIEPGTFADLLRYGSVHFEQTRSQITVIQTEKPTETMKKGIFEP
ncbi:hypothetical protein EYB26_000049 [Talaromyces marneffei]|uniref:uncharacterized protein n=1 Tax=Talaromyces marneffei TaxID=37727 RepID=UPI0012AA0C10|nr:uncharacterized protein EYB26_000049 [Talaromyces marneffei]QGA12405.1 hypothetical protein EYB26_000049 [Talaromyces marneffei]